MAAPAQPQQKKTLLMTEGSIWKSILLFSVPLILVTGAAFWQWLTGFDSVEGLIDDVSRIEIGDVRQARQECIGRLQKEMRRALEENSLGDTMNDVQLLKQRLC